MLVDDPARTDTAALRVMVVDDHDLFRSGLRRLLDEQADLEVVGEARRGDEAVTRAAQLRPDVVVMDVNMPGMSGADAMRAVLAASPGSAVLMLSVTSDEHEVLDAVLAGAAGHLLKDTTLPEIVRAIRATAAGQSIIAPAVAGDLLARLRSHGPPDPVLPPAGPQLSAREVAVLRLVVAGCDDVQDVNVTDAANATATVKEASGNLSTLFFVRQSGRWRIRSVQPA